MNRRSFLQLAVTAALAPTISKLPSLGEEAPALSEAALEEAIIELGRHISNPAIRINIHPTLLWPGVKAYWDRALIEQPIYWTELYKDA